MTDKKPLSIKEFITNVKRNYRSKQTQTNRVLRWKVELDLINEHTELYITGQIEKENFLSLQDIKNYLSQLPNNPFEMVHGEANAKICADAHKLSIKGIILDGKKQQIVAKSLGINRVGYFNIQYARELIAKEKDTKQKQLMEDRLKIIQQLPDREGYNPL